MSDIEPESTINSLEGLAAAFDIAHEKFNCLPLFRGQRDGTWKLLPKIFRIIQLHGHEPGYEHIVAQAFRARAPLRYTNCPSEDDDFGWLSLMRHFFLPTRLLDWTESILVAAYFAVAGRSEPNEPAIWALDPYHLNQEMAETLRSAPHFIPHNIPPYPCAPSNRVIRALAGAPFDRGTNYGGVYSVIPPEKDLRMLLQHATFTIQSNPHPLDRNVDLRDCLAKFSLTADFRDRLRSMLPSLGLHRAVLFPDLENLSRSIEEFVRLPPPKPRSR